MQSQIEFPTTSPINQLRLTGQNKRLYDFLMQGNKIHCFHPAKIELKIGYLNSRIADLRKFVTIKSENIKVLDSSGEQTIVKLYWI